MEKDIYIQRVRILQAYCIFFGLLIALRLLTLTINYNYSPKGISGTTLATIIFLFGLNFIYLIYHYIKKFGPGALVSLKDIYREWKTLSPLNKVVVFSGLISMPTTLIAIGKWLSSLVSYLLN